jgi:hypothetical protein
MSAWGIGLYASDFALDLRATVGAVARLPLDEDKLVAAICAAEETTAENPADEDHTVFWLVLADQFEKRGIFSARVREKALAIIDGGKDAEMMGKLGLQPADLRKRAAKLAELRARILAQPTVSKPRKTMAGPAPYVFEVGGVYAYPIRGGEPINPYLSAKQFNRSEWQAQGFGLMLVITRARAFDYLPWYHAATTLEAVASIPDRTKLLGEIRWGQPIYGTCNPAHFRNMELTELGVFPLDRGRIDRFFPHLAPGTVYAVQDISIANKMQIPGDQRPRRWRRPDGKLEQIVYSPRPTIAELMGDAA